LRFSRFGESAIIARISLAAGSLETPMADIDDIGIALRMDSVSKRYPGTLAVDGVDFEVRAGEAWEKGTGYFNERKASFSFIKVACPLFSPGKGERR